MIVIISDINNLKRVMARNMFVVVRNVLNKSIDPIYHDTFQ